LKKTISLKNRIGQHTEILIFTLITLINLLFFVSYKFFPTLDGAAHLSNANIINQIVVHHNELFRQFFMINPEPVPNWTSHMFLAILNLIMPAFLAEKLLLILLLAGMPFAFRNLMQTIAPGKIWCSYLIFPFTHSMFFFFGFYNFCIASLFFLITLNYWLRNEASLFSVRKIIVLTLLLLVTYFSHILIFGFLGLLLGQRILTVALYDLMQPGSKFLEIGRRLLQKLFALLIASGVQLFLVIYFFYSRPSTQLVTYIPKKELLQYIYQIRPLISMNQEIEGRFTRILFFLFLLMTLAGVIVWIIRYIRNAERVSLTELQRLDSGHNPRINIWWLTGSLVMGFTLFLFVPDAYGTASYTNLRIAYLLFMLLILWFSLFRLPAWLGIFSAAVAVYVNFSLIMFYLPPIRENNKIAMACNKAADKIAPNSLVLPIYCMDSWFHGHFVDYLSIDKPVLMVYNYECEMGYFPVKWNEKTKPNYHLGNSANPSNYINFELIKGHPSLKLDYVFILGNYDPNKDWFFTTLHRILKEEFIRVYTSDFCSLYQNRNP